MKLLIDENLSFAEASDTTSWAVRRVAATDVVHGSGRPATAAARIMPAYVRFIVFQCIIVLR